MINLLPPQEKEELVLQKYKRLVIVLGNMTLIILICLTLILFALKFYVLSEIDLQKINLDLAQKKYEADDTNSLKQTISQYNELLIKIDNFYKKNILVSDILVDLLKIDRPKGLYFQDISIDRPQRNEASLVAMKISINGFANTREDLSIFKENLEKNSQFKNVSFPPQNWVREKDINFSATLENK